MSIQKHIIRTVNYNFFTFILGIVLLNACSSNSTKKDSIAEARQSVAIDTIENSQLDSLQDPYSFYYLSDLSLRKCAKWMLQDSISPSDNFITFRIMDSASDARKEVRDYYFPVFLKIIQKADGALAEIVGDETQFYVRMFPKEFIQRSKFFSDSLFKSIAYFTAFEIGYQYESNPKIWTDSVLKNCIDCDSFTINRLNEFNQIVIQTIAENAMENAY